MRNHEVDVELWLGLNGDPINGGDLVNDRLATVLEDPKASGFISAIGVQYDSRNQMACARELYPDKKLIQTETECNRGENTWADAQRLYDQMKRYFDNGANAYFLWNMVLDDTGMSTWNWRQNAPITVNRRTGKVAYNGEYFVMRHFSQFVKPGAKRVLATGIWGDKIAFVNPNGSTVLVMGNSADRTYDVNITVAGRADNDTISVTMPARSINTFVFPKPSSERVASSQ